MIKSTVTSKDACAGGQNDRAGYNGIELLDANEQLHRTDMGKLLVINEATGNQIDVPLC